MLSTRVHLPDLHTKTPLAAPPFPIIAPWWTIIMPQLLLSVHCALQGHKFGVKQLEFSFPRFSFLRFVARRARGRVIMSLAA